MEIKLKCGCEIFNTRKNGLDILYCPLHKAAPRMYEALKELEPYIEWLEKNKLIRITTLLQQAIAGVEK